MQVRNRNGLCGFSIMVRRFPLSPQVNTPRDNEPDCIAPRHF